MKSDFAFVEFSDHRDADEARYQLDGRDVDGSRLIVEFAKGVPRGSQVPHGSREYLGRGPAPGSGRCFNCGLDGHWARDCKAGDWKNKCYRCGERGHIEKNCKSSPKKLRHDRSYSRSPTRSRSPRRGRSRDRSYSRERSYSRSRSPVHERSPIRKDRSESPRYRSREPKSSPRPSKARKHSPSPDQGSPQKSGDTSPDNDRLARREDVSDYSPREKSGSPASPARSHENDSRSPRDDDHSHSPRDDDHSHSPRDDDLSCSPRDDDCGPRDNDHSHRDYDSGPRDNDHSPRDDDDNHHRSPRDSRSP